MALLGAAVVFVLALFFGGGSAERKDRGEQPRDGKGRFKEFE